MPAEKLAAPNLDRLELPQPAWTAARPWLVLNLGLRQIMILLVYCSVVSLVGRSVYEGGSPVARVLLGVLIGIGVSYLGVWLAVRLRGLAFVGWIIFIIGYIVATASMLGVLVVPAVPIVVGVVIYLLIQHRRHQQDGLLWVLAVAADRGIPLAPGVEAYSQQNRGIYRERTHALAALVQAGQSLSEAIKWVPGVVPWDAPLLIRIGEQTGRLAVGLREAAETRSKRHYSLRNALGRLGYLAVVLSTVEGVVGFTTFFIVPRFAAIFRDFGFNLPVATTWLLEATSVYSHYLTGIGVGQVALIFYLIYMLGGRGLQGVPILGRLFRLRHKSLILRALAMVVEAEQPLGGAFEIMAREYPSPRVRRKLSRAAELIRSGSEWTTALQFVRIINAADVGVLDAASRAGNLPWALRTLAGSGERRFAYRLQIGSHLLFLVSILALGVLVLFIAVALFVPLVELIERLA